MLSIFEVTAVCFVFYVSWDMKVYGSTLSEVRREPKKRAGRKDGRTDSQKNGWAMWTTKGKKGRRLKFALK